MLREFTMGEMRDLVKDIGINPDQKFINAIELQKHKDDLLHYASDYNFKNLASAIITPIDMTEYEYHFTGFGEANSYNLWGINMLDQYDEDPIMEKDAFHTQLPEEKREPMARNLNHLDILEAAIAAKEAGEEEDEDDEYGSEGGDEDEEGEGDGDYGEEVPEKMDLRFEPPRELSLDKPVSEFRYFNNGEEIYDKFNDVELDAFLHILNIRPNKMWQDRTLHHYKMGTHTYEDDSQMLDPLYHVLAEVERKEAERQVVKSFRSGSEIKLELGKKKPRHHKQSF
mmetsp:Transcript_34566/g.25693  ORF Transcript_34566/g.25693 Transcript_34566/m.25693 type:complete len:284 (-) Transcript_34566:32-883(-)